MNRRSFITKLLAAGVAPMILPAAGRIWKPTLKEVIEVNQINPEWEDAPFEVTFFMHNNSYEAVKFGPPPKDLPTIPVIRYKFR